MLLVDACVGHGDGLRLSVQGRGLNPKWPGELPLRADCYGIADGQGRPRSSAVCETGCLLDLVAERAPSVRIADVQVVVSIEETG